MPPPELPPPVPRAASAAALRATAATAPEEERSIPTPKSGWPRSVPAGAARRAGRLAPRLFERHGVLHAGRAIGIDEDAVLLRDRGRGGYREHQQRDEGRASGQ